MSDPSPGCRELVSYMQHIEENYNDDNLRVFSCVGACDEKPDNSRYPFPGKCRRFINCNSGLVKVHKCSDSKLYNWVTKTCENVTKNTACKGKKS